VTCGHRLIFCLHTPIIAGGRTRSRTAPTSKITIYSWSISSADTVEALIVHGGYRGGVAVALTDPTGWGDLFTRDVAR
jgi:hypothetical protein